MGVFIFLTLVHILFFLSIFEIYFKSPLVDNIPVSQKASGVQLTKRVVIFYADGVRAQKFYEISINNSSNAPYLRTLLEKHEACGGIAHTQVPTETRPGAIAMFAGFYEDPSAIFKGWQDNPVEFDHIFKQSEFSVAFGSPDVLKMFSRGFKNTKADKFHFEFYDENEQQFKNENQLNYWVGNKTLHYLKNNQGLSWLNQDKVIFMLHFLGPDTAGHNFKPHSKEYADNILVVDHIVKTVADSINEYYNHDHQTAFIYASDHGMTDWGSHGDGSQHETETPFVAWGAGVTCPSFSPSLNSDSFMPHSQGRLDIAQVDIVSLVATLLGVSIPVHSVGELPLQYLALDKAQQALVIRSNAIQIHNAFRTLQSQRRESIARFLFKPFYKLTEHEEGTVLKEIELGLKIKDFESVISQYKRLMKLSLEGLVYYHTYHQTFLLICVTLAYLGLLRLLLISTRYSSDVTYWQFWYDWRHFVMWCVLLFYCYNIGLSLTSYVFVLLPTVTLFCMDTIVINGPTLDVEYIHVYICGILMLVVTFYHRWILSLLLLSIVTFCFLKDKSSLRNYYIFSLMPLTLFPLLPIVGTQDSNKYLLIIAAAVWFSLLTYGVRKKKGHTNSAVLSQLIILGVTIVHLILWSAEKPHWFQFLISWLILVISPLSIFLSSTQTEERLISIGGGLAPAFILLCSTYEVFFFMFLCLHLMCWYRVEANERKEGCNMHNAFLILVYLFLCFFGLGNIASISSYDWNCVRYFLNVFSPFTMLAFCLAKIFIPFLCVSCAMRAIHVEYYTMGHSWGERYWDESNLRKGAERILLLVLSFCDMMGLVFLFLVRNTGSWKEIGLSISHVVIVHCITLALMCLYAVASHIVPMPSVKMKY